MRRPAPCDAELERRRRRPCRARVAGRRHRAGDDAEHARARPASRPCGGRSPPPPSWRLAPREVVVVLHVEQHLAPSARAMCGGSARGWPRRTGPSAPSPPSTPGPACAVRSSQARCSSSRGQLAGAGPCASSAVVLARPRAGAAAAAVAEQGEVLARLSPSSPRRARAARRTRRSGCRCRWCRAGSRPCPCSRCGDRRDAPVLVHDVVLRRCLERWRRRRSASRARSP